MKSWGIDIINKENWIDPNKKYTCNGYDVIGIQINLFNSINKEVTYPVKGSIVKKRNKRGLPSKLEYAMWSLDGKNNVVFEDSNLNLIIKD